MNDGFCFGVFGEHKKQKVPFLLRERLPGILKNLMFPPNFPPNFPWKQYLVVGRVFHIIRNYWGSCVLKNAKYWNALGDFL